MKSSVISPRFISFPQTGSSQAGASGRHVPKVVWNVSDCAGISFVTPTNCAAPPYRPRSQAAPLHTTHRTPRTTHTHHVRHTHTHIQSHTHKPCTTYTMCHMPHIPHTNHIPHTTHTRTPEAHCMGLPRTPPWVLPAVLLCHLSGVARASCTVTVGGRGRSSVFPVKWLLLPHEGPIASAQHGRGSAHHTPATSSPHSQ